jgi:hypothetical protein
MALSHERFLLIRTGYDLASGDFERANEIGVEHQRPLRKVQLSQFSIFKAGTREKAVPQVR